MIDCANPTRLASFWSAILGIPATAEHGEHPGWATIGSRFDSRPRLTFQRVTEPKIGKVRIHLARSHRPPARPAGRPGRG
ncbi:VOC family protein [Nocardia thailandica]|uniref:VOC family protein n=1 Tax=Nocardia thailandica TaxID=257275 RepID=A0ABW6PVP5_9NOCA